MVFDDDVQWQKDYLSCHRASGYAIQNNVRYRSFGTESLLIDCIRMFTPFVRTLYIILARESQKRDWMEQDGVRVVYHSDFIPRQYRPCFNSCTIEMFMPFISSLSEHFIYGNDDMFPLSPMKEEDFFVDGKPCQHIKEEEYPDDPNIFQQKCMIQQNMVGGAFGKRYTHTLLRNGHSLAPMLKSQCLKVRKVFDDEITRGITLVRKETSYNQYLYVLWQYFTGNYVDRTPKRTYVSVKDGVEKVRQTLLAPDVGIVCVNDHDDVIDITDYSAVMQQTIKEKLSIYKNG